MCRRAGEIAGVTEAVRRCFLSPLQGKERVAGRRPLWCMVWAVYSARRFSMAWQTQQMADQEQATQVINLSNEGTNRMINGAYIAALTSTMPNSRHAWPGTSGRVLTEHDEWPDRPRTS